jgi:uncharacterized protein YegP (UPF0339 family)
MVAFSVYKDTAGGWRWTLWADNNKRIADSAEGYKNRADCIAGIGLVKRGAPSAKAGDMSGKEQQEIPNF